MAIGKKFVYVKHGDEPTKIKATEMFRTVKGAKGEYRIIGKYVKVHIAKGEKPTDCSGDGCQLCKAENVAQARYRTEVIAIEDGIKRPIDMQFTLANMIAEKQALMQEMDKTEEEILDTGYAVSKNAPKSTPLYNVVLLKADKKGESAKTTPVPAKPKGKDAVSELDAEIPSEAQLAPEDQRVVLSYEEIGQLEKIEKKLKENLAKGVSFDMSKSVAKALKESFKWKDAERIEHAVSLFDGEGNLDKEKA